MKKIGALEAGGTKMVMAVGYEDGTILTRDTVPTRFPEETMPDIIRFFREQGAEAVGVGSFGPIDVRRNSPTYGYIKNTPKTGWREYDILGTIGRELGVPTAFDTDVNAAALGEYTFGAAKGTDSCIYMTVGTGIGIGVILDGKPLHGALHPEGGHIFLKPRAGETFKGCCPFHEYCLEGMAAGPALRAKWGKPGSELADVPEVWEAESDYLAQAIADFILTLSPERIILGGGVMKQEQLFPMIREKVLRYLNGYLSIAQLADMDSYIVPPALHDNQGILGCIALFRK